MPLSRRGGSGGGTGGAAFTLRDHVKGPWVAGASYSPDDLVSRNGRLFVVNADASNIDPASHVAAPVFEIFTSDPNHSSSVQTAKTAQGFKLSADQLVLGVSLFSTVGVSQGPHPLTVGIATALGGTGTPTWVASKDFAGFTFPTGFAWSNFIFDSVVKLVAGTQYYVIVSSTDSIVGACWSFANTEERTMSGGPGALGDAAYKLYYNADDSQSSTEWSHQMRLLPPGAEYAQVL